MWWLPRYNTGSFSKLRTLAFNTNALWCTYVGTQLFFIN